MDAAEALLLAGDPESISAHAIARAVGVTPGALYRYFPGIDAIVARVQARVITHLWATVDASMARAPEGAGLIRVVAATDGLLAFAESCPAEYALLAKMLAVPRSLVGEQAAGPVVAQVLIGLQRIRVELESARQAGDLAPGDSMSRLLTLWACLHGSIQIGKLSRFQPDARGDRIGRDAVDALLVGWGASPHMVRHTREVLCRTSP